MFFFNLGCQNIPSAEFIHVTWLPFSPNTGMEFAEVLPSYVYEPVRQQPNLRLSCPWNPWDTVVEISGSQDIFLT